MIVIEMKRLRVKWDTGSKPIMTAQYKNLILPGLDDLG